MRCFTLLTMVKHMSEYDEAIKRFLAKGAIMLEVEAKRAAPVRDGDLRDNITVFPQVRDNEISVGNSALIDYAVHVYYGTKPHVIRPKKAKALKTPYGYRKKVNHPGTKANPYLDNALDALVRSGRIHRLLGEFGDEMSEEIFEGISASLNNIKVK